MQAFADSTLTSTSDSARIVLRDGTVADEGGAARWTATLTWTGKDGQLQVVTYPMERSGP